MSKSYVIQWKSLVNGRSGKGTKQFGLEEAQQLAAELNREYPAIVHETVEANFQTPEPAQNARQPEPAGNAEGQTERPPETMEPDSALSFR